MPLVIKIKCLLDLDLVVLFEVQHREILTQIGTDVYNKDAHWKLETRVLHKVLK